MARKTRIETAVDVLRNEGWVVLTENEAAQARAFVQVRSAVAVRGSGRGGEGREVTMARKTRIETAVDVLHNERWVVITENEAAQARAFVQVRIQEAVRSGDSAKLIRSLLEVYAALNGEVDT